MDKDMSEKMKILKMLEDKKINAQEAARLLEAAGSGGEAWNSGSPSGETWKSGDAWNGGAWRQSEARNQGGSSAWSDNRGSDRQYDRGAKMDSFANDLARKWDTLARDLEPGIRKIAEKAVSAVDSLSRSIDSQIQASQARSAGRAAYSSPKAPFGAGGGIEKDYQFKLSGEYNQLSLNCQNGPCIVKGYNGDTLSAKVYYKTKTSAARFDFTVMGGKYFLDYDDEQFERVAVDVFIPERLFQSVYISNINGDVDVSSISSAFLNVETRAAAVSVANVSVTDLIIDIADAKNVTLENISAKNGKIDLTSGTVEARNLEIQNLKLSSCNGVIAINSGSFTRYSEYYWAVDTSNAKINLNLPSNPGVGYYLKSETTLGDVKLSLTGLEYLQNSGGRIEARSKGFDGFPTKVRLGLETTNAVIRIG